MMTTKECIEQRYSVRAYLPTKVSEEDLVKIMDVVRLAPSAVNYQPWKFFVVTNKDLIEDLQKCYARDWLKTAPVVIVACGNHEQSWKRSMDDKDYADIDVAIAVDHLLLAATELGYGSCWVCNFDTLLCREKLNLPDSLEPIALIPIGYAATTNLKEKKRKPIDEIVEWVK